MPEQSLVVKPDVAPNTPAGQREHVAGSVILLFLAPGRAYDPVGQVTVPVQVALVRPTVDPYVPPGQGAHADGSVTVLEDAPARA